MQVLRGSSQTCLTQDAARIQKFFRAQREKLLSSTVTGTRVPQPHEKAQEEQQEKRLIEEEDQKLSLIHI